MPNLLVEYPPGDQKIIEISDSGDYFDKSRVLWDERADGVLPNDIELGKMVRNGTQLEKLSEFKADYLALKQAKEQENILKKNADLWAAADAYIYATINGVALSILSLGVSQAKPKARAVATWCDSVWTEYYIRKAGITAQSDVNLDFSNMGDKPYTVLELREEVAVIWTTP